MAIRSAGDFGEPGELEGTPSLVEDSWLTVSFSASFSRMLVFLRANRSFRGVFGFSDGDAKVCFVCSQLPRLTFLSFFSSAVLCIRGSPGSQPIFWDV